eukprot:5038138-Pleurochrysis_carterae.AAC.2
MAVSSGKESRSLPHSRQAPRSASLCVQRYGLWGYTYSPVPIIRRASPSGTWRRAARAAKRANSAAAAKGVGFSRRPAEQHRHRQAVPVYQEQPQMPCKRKASMQLSKAADRISPSPTPSGNVS